MNIQKAKYHWGAWTNSKKRPPNSQPELQVVLRHFSQQSNSRQRASSLHVRSIYQTNCKLGCHCLTKIPQCQDTCLKIWLQISFPTMSSQRGHGSSNLHTTRRNWPSPYDADSYVLVILVWITWSWLTDSCKKLDIRITYRILYSVASRPT